MVCFCFSSAWSFMNESQKILTHRVDDCISFQMNGLNMSPWHLSLLTNKTPDIRAEIIHITVGLFYLMKITP